MEKKGREEKQPLKKNNAKGLDEPGRKGNGEERNEKRAPIIRRKEHSNQSMMSEVVEIFFICRLKTEFSLQDGGRFDQEMPGWAFGIPREQIFLFLFVVPKLRCCCAQVKLQYPLF